jgi:hypothetical protein
VIVLVQKSKARAASRAASASSAHFGFSLEACEREMYKLLLVVNVLKRLV